MLYVVLIVQQLQQAGKQLKFDFSQLLHIRVLHNKIIVPSFIHHPVHLFLPFSRKVLGESEVELKFISFVFQLYVESLTVVG